MDENRLSGTAKNLGGKVEEGLGRATGDARTQAQGQMKQAEGSVQDIYGQAKDTTADAISAVREMVPDSVKDILEEFIENRPYTAVAVALAVGWFLGRSHRPF
jgi:uncharacterized protein YjbJ (UPF0337 family)